MTGSAAIGNRSRVAITFGTTVVLGAGTYVHVLHPGFLGVAGFIAPWALAPAGVFVVYRWWALLPALAYPVVFGFAHTHTSYSARWSSESVTFGGPVANALVGIAICLVIFTIPLVLRWFWELGRSWIHECVSTG